MGPIQSCIVVAVAAVCMAYLLRRLQDSRETSKITMSTPVVQLTERNASHPGIYTALASRGEPIVVQGSIGTVTITHTIRLPEGCLGHATTLAVHSTLCTWVV